MTASSEAVVTQLSAGALAGHWALDPAQSTVSLRAKTFWGLATVKGRFREVSGEGDVTADGHVSGRLSVASASVDTHNAKRDNHLRSADFFSADTDAAITFDVSGVDASSGELTVAGTLTVRRQSLPLSFPANASVSDSRVTVDAIVPVDRTAFGLTWNQLGAMVGKTATIGVHAVFARG